MNFLTITSFAPELALDVEMLNVSLALAILGPDANRNHPSILLCANVFHDQTLKKSIALSGTGHGIVFKLQPYSTVQHSIRCVDFKPFPMV